MAVSSPDQPNLNPAYGNIIDALNRRASLEAAGPGKYGLINAFAQPVSQGILEKSKSDRELAANRNLLDYKSQLELRSQGKKEFTEDIKLQLEQQYPDLVGEFEPLVGGFHTTDEVADFITTRKEQKAGEEFAATLSEEEKLKAKAMGVKEYLKNTSKKSDPKSFQQYLMSLVNSGQITFEEAAQGYAEAFPKTFESKRTGEREKIVPFKGTKPITGPEPKPEGQALRTEIKQLNNREIGLVEKASDDVEKDETIKKLRDTRNEIQAIRDLVNSGNEAAYPILKFRIVRGIGREVGAMSQKDVVSGVGSEELARQAQRKAKIWATGELPQEDIQDFLQMADLVEKSVDRDLNKAIDQHVRRTIGKFEVKDVDPNVIKNAIDLSIPKIKKVRDEETGKKLEAFVYPDGRIVPINGAE